MFKRKIKLSDSTTELVKRAAQCIGAVSVDEFAEKILHDEAEKILAQYGQVEPSAEEIEDVARKLKGLGYLE